MAFLNFYLMSVVQWDLYSGCHWFPYWKRVNACVRGPERDGTTVKWFVFITFLYFNLTHNVG